MTTAQRPLPKLRRQPTDEDRANPHPIYAVWEITLACDLGCRHCGSRAGEVRPSELSTAECLEVCRQLDENGVREVTLIGGEFYLRDDWHLIARELSDRDITVTCVTGARNLTDDILKKAVDAGVRGISVSIDGLEKTHDALRGRKGSWRAAVDATRRIAMHGMRPQHNTQLNRLSVPEMPALADLLVDLGGKAWQLQLTTPMGHAADRVDLLLQPFDYLELFPMLVWIKQTKLDPGGCGLFLGNNIGYFGPYERFLRYGGTHGMHWNGCGAGKYAIGIESDGKVKGCPSLPTHPYTSGRTLRDHTLHDIYSNDEEITHIQHLGKKDLWGFRATCYYADVCKGGCNWVSSTLMGKSGNNPYCIHRALQFEAQGLRERVVRVEDAAGMPYDYGRFEIVVEPMEGMEAPHIIGVPIESVAALSPEDGSVRPVKEMAAVLRLPRP